MGPPEQVGPGTHVVLLSVKSDTLKLAEPWTPCSLSRTSVSKKGDAAVEKESPSGPLPPEDRFPTGNVPRIESGALPKLLYKVSAYAASTPPKQRVSAQRQSSDRNISLLPAVGADSNDCRIILSFERHVRCLNRPVATKRLADVRHFTRCK